MNQLRDEETVSLTANQKPSSPYVRGRRRASLALIASLLGFSAIVFRTSTRLDPRVDSVVSRNKKSNSDHEDSFCYIAGKAPLDRALDILELRRRAEVGLNQSNPQQAVTSLNRTAAAFPQSPAKFMEKLSRDHNNWFFGVTFDFSAIDTAGHPMTVGGDEFVLTLQGWSLEYSFKTSVYATDLHNGTYKFTATLPRHRIEHMNVTLMHYYTAYEGFGYYGIQGSKYRGISVDLDHGPLMVELPKNVLDYLDNVQDTTSLQSALEARPPCQSTQEGVDQLMAGIWIEQGLPVYNDLSLEAKWEPFCCRPPKVRKSDEIQFFRIGSSTMPLPSVHVGDAYDLQRPFHERWVDALLNTLPRSTVNDTVLFSAGLHQLLYGYNPETAAVLVKRMICQIAAVFPGKIIYVGPCPIQQQLFRKIDMTDQHVLLLNAMLRKEVVNDLGGQLHSFCHGVDLALMVSYPDTESGALLNPEKTRDAVERQRKRVPETESELALINKLRLSQTDNSNRTLYFAEINDFLRPRPETYRENDKVHDIRQFDKGMLFFGAHSTVIEHLMILRNLGDF
ncbi:hypothetical protein FisN_18Hh042 [Fistulifera solaris]|uniref:Uncharacterized protein n=1 Tax=Fistulifera solaris TaxID=1519565 RepID=A0A1Z5JVT5_FISSO|nr:hypothetical protein FisN_18Hh042 [Fistulifera solaris]|eukprot:GAX17841.1 hypothetical protein FisN_18Hh042 [Fistulifera solaris]